MAFDPPDPNSTDWVPIWNPMGVGPAGPQGPPGDSLAATPWTPYTPIWTGAGTIQPILGNSTLTGRYIVLGKICFFDLHFIVGSTASLGNGNYYLSPPPFAPLVNNVAGPVIPAWGNFATFEVLAVIFQTNTQLVFLKHGVSTAVNFSNMTAGMYLHTTGFYEMA